MERWKCALFNYGVTMSMSFCALIEILERCRTDVGLMLFLHLIHGNKSHTRENLYVYMLRVYMRFREVQVIRNRAQKKHSRSSALHVRIGEMGCI